MPAAAHQRMAWLDALRAVAALLVVYAHFTHYQLTEVRAATSNWINSGVAGVMLFFLVSGYIIPASLERHGDLRRFWVSRLARLYPLYLAVGVAVVIVLPVAPYLVKHPVAGTVAHLTMLPQFTGYDLVTPVMWTLTFEMAFYLLVASLFVLRLHRASAPIAAAFGVAAVLTVPLTPRQLVTPLLPVAIAVVLIAGLAGLLSRRRAVAVAGAVTLIALVLTLMITNQHPSHAFDGLLIPAVMFTGTAIYRAEKGQIPKRHAAAAATVVGAACLVNWFAELRSLNALTPQYMTRSVITLLIIGGSFAIGFACRHRRVPRSLAWIGLVSYSLYLIHVPVIDLTGQWFQDHIHGPAEILATAGFLAGLLGLSWLTHRYIELPGQRLAKRYHPAPPGGAVPAQRRPEVLAERDDGAGAPGGLRRPDHVMTGQAGGGVRTDQRRVSGGDGG
ncbi:acyltransferase family protein [Actinoplanes sp. NPDC026619]|uniref:acyltransferase family protein n=1 Tax=Actinoplanes sp. NPDC026619 TaxID=3155798 RepID=UPI0033F3858A